jgi:hypothetical protein
MVTITAQSGAKIYYTLNGGDPVYGGRLYTGPFSAPGAATVRAVAAYCLNGDRGAESSVTVKKLHCAPPDLNGTDGRLTLAASYPTEMVRYTLDGTKAVGSAPCIRSPWSLPPARVNHAFTLGTDGTAASRSPACNSGRGNFFRDV